MIDTGGCECALQEQLGSEAWRCLFDNIASIYNGQDGKWFYAINQTDNASLTEPENSDSNPPNLSKSYDIQTDRWRIFSPLTEAGNANYALCTGINNTQASETFYKDVNALLSGRDNPCLQPGTVPLIVQSASSWNATGCSLGFFCKLYHT